MVGSLARSSVDYFIDRPSVKIYVVAVKVNLDRVASMEFLTSSSSTTVALLLLRYHYSLNFVYYV